MSTLKLFWMGTPQIELDDNPCPIEQAKAVALLAYLSVTQSKQTRNALATMLWPELEQKDARGNLRHILWRLRKAIGDQRLTTDRKSIRLVEDAELFVDVSAYTAQFEKSLDVTHPTDPVRIQQLVDIAELYRGDFLVGFTLPNSPEFDEWQFFQREALRQKQVRLLAKLIAMQRALADYDAALVYAHQGLALDTLHEPSHRLIMELYAESGQDAAAVRQYDKWVHILNKELGVPPDEETTELYNTIRARRFPIDDTVENPQDDDPVLSTDLGGTVKPSPASSAKQFSSIAPVAASKSNSEPILQADSESSSHTLPNQLTSFVGRTTEMTEIQALVLEKPDCRLLSIVGAGGIGKTRLALEAASILRDHFSHGAIFVTLSALERPEQIVLALLDAFELRAPGDTDLKDYFLHYLQDKQILLVLDNFDHLLDGAELLPEILQCTPAVDLIVTSREPLELHEEWLYRLEGLEMPAQSEVVIDHSADSLIETYSAAQLFVQRAHRAHARFQLTDKDIPALIRICQLVNGAPLGLELAAPWVSHMSISEIVDEIRQNLDFLATTKRNVPDRHRSLRAVFEQSWQLLHNEEQDILGRLTLFRGGFTRHSAADVACASLPILVRLTDKALLFRLPNGRYQMHELIQQFVEEKFLTQPRVIQQAKDDLCGYFANSLKSLELDFQNDQQAQAYEWMRQEIHNIQASWEYVYHEERVELVEKFIDSLGNYYTIHSLPQQGLQFMTRALERLRTASYAEAARAIALSQVLSWQGIFYLSIDELSMAEKSFQESTLFAHHAEDPESIAIALGWLATIEERRYQFEPMKKFAQEGLDIARVANLTLIEARMLTQLARGAFNLSDYSEAEKLLTDALAIYRQHGHHFYVDLTMGALATAMQLCGEFAKAKDLILSAIALQEQMGSQHRRFTLYSQLGDATQSLGSYQEAQEFYQQSLTLCQELELEAQQTYGLMGLAQVARLEGNMEEAQGYLQQSLSIFESTEWTDGIARNLYQQGLLALAQADYSRAEKCFIDSHTIYAQLEQREGMAMTIRGMGQVFHGLGKWPESQTQYDQALLLAPESAKPIVLEILAQQAVNFIALGDVSTGLRNLTFVEQQSSATYETRRFAQIERARYL